MKIWLLKSKSSINKVNLRLKRWLPNMKNSRNKVELKLKSWLKSWKPKKQISRNNMIPFSKTWIQVKKLSKCLTKSWILLMILWLLLLIQSKPKRLITKRMLSKISFYKRTLSNSRNQPRKIFKAKTLNSMILRSCSKITKRKSKL